MQVRLGINIRTGKITFLILKSVLLQDYWRLLLVSHLQIRILKQRLELLFIEIIEIDWLRLTRLVNLGKIFENLLSFSIPFEHFLNNNGC